MQGLKFDSIIDKLILNYWRNIDLQHKGLISKEKSSQDQRYSLLETASAIENLL